MLSAGSLSLGPLFGATNLARVRQVAFSRGMHDSNLGFDAARHTAPLASSSERRHARRGNPLVDLCHFLELARREAGLATLTLADEEGLVIAGAGRYSDCEEVGALATCAASAEGPVVLSRFELLGSWVSLCAPSQGLSVELAERTRAACSRILERRIRPLRH